jgi:hypothetical protein
MTMRHPLLGLAVALGIASFAPNAQAQLITGSTDPTILYYSIYLPRQQAQALNPGPEATLNAITQVRQANAATNRNDLFDPNAGTGLGGVDLGPDFAVNSGGRRRSITAIGGRYGVHGGNLNGLGPQGFYNAKLNSYYRELKTGRGRNAYTYTPRGRGLSGGGFGGGGGYGMPGPR